MVIKFHEISRVELITKLFHSSESYGINLFIETIHLKNMKSIYGRYINLYNFHCFSALNYYYWLNNLSHSKTIQVR